MGRRDAVVDACVVALVVTQGQLEAWAEVGSSNRPGPAWAFAVAYGAAGLSLWFRRSRPMATLVAGSVLLGLHSFAFGSPEGWANVLTLGVAAYSAGRWAPRRRTAWALAVLAAEWAVWAVCDPLTTTWSQRLGTIVWLFPLIIAWLVGALLRQRAHTREQRAVAHDEHARRELAEQRNRIARELHDSVGHSVVAMTMQASAVRRRLDPALTAEHEALASVESVGREAMVELRRLVEVLRDDTPASREAPHTLADVPRLVDSFGDDGPRIVVTTVGEVVPLPAGLELTAFRVIQEGLTNAIRHARDPRRIDVEVRHEHGVTISVRDDGRVPPTPIAPGHGLRGIMERASLFGGTVAASPRADGGFELTVRLPDGAS